MTDPASLLILRYCFLRGVPGAPFSELPPLAFLQSKACFLGSTPILARANVVGRALTGSLLSSGDCISQQYELALGNLNVLSLLPRTLQFYLARSANPSECQIFGCDPKSHILLIFHKYSKHKSFKRHKSQCKLPPVHIVWKATAELESPCLV